jgi:hypothetical protein
MVGSFPLHVVWYSEKLPVDLMIVTLYPATVYPLKVEEGVHENRTEVDE